MKSNSIIVLLLVNSIALFGQKELYVSASGNEHGDGSASDPFATLDQAVGHVPAVLDEPYTIILDGDAGDILSGTGTVVIETRGTLENQLTITSLECRATVVKPANVSLMIQVKYSSYVNIQHIHFAECMPRAIHIRYTSDHINVRYCEFSGGPQPVAPVSSGVLILTGDDGITRDCDISYNYFHDLWINAFTNQHHPIYISDNAHDNEIYGNTIINGLAYGIHAWHCNYQDNTVQSNCIQQYPLTLNQEVRAIVFGVDYDAVEIQYNCPKPPDNINNLAYWNYAFDDDNSNVVSIDIDLIPYNILQENKLYTSFKPTDPYWMDYHIDNVRNRLAAGDFDDDGDTDMAALRQDGTNVNIDRWYSYQGDHALVYSPYNPSNSSPWWYGAYDASKVHGRVVGVDFNGDGYTDIAAFRDNGPSASGNSTEIDLWVNVPLGSMFKTVVWSSPGSYTASMITDRVVSGDFNGDGYGDLAAMYDYGSGESRIHVWLGYSGGFIFQGSSGWWSSLTYTASRVKNRMVAGDFNGDGMDDIAAVYDYGASGGVYESRVHVFLSTGTAFNNTGSPGWWSALGFTASQVSGRLAVGNFAGSWHDDLAAIYDHGGGVTSIKVWETNNSGNGFAAYGSYWSTTGGYTASQLTDAVVGGRFSQNTSLWPKEGILGFYEYGWCSTTRTHVWRPGDEEFILVNASLGYPWLLYETYEGKTQAETYAQNMEVEHPEALPEVLVYPNPANERIWLRTSLPLQRVEIRSLDGRLVSSAGLSDPAEYAISVTGITPGCYVLSWHYPGGRGSKLVTIAQ